ncbi:hypothetical protein SASPL_136694 [Salvia splendens]|uniref:Protein kinase domain-containing protein n=1 Tax=Salvia splendens TaxID=180675 RepID=A0A8X8X2N8_SALSN|nr:hypothetical protein SASPL_136694 [Salvia splendens]
MGSCCSARIGAHHSPQRDGKSSRYVSFDGSLPPSVPLTPRNEAEILDTGSLKSFGYNDLRICTRNFRPDSMLGEGGFGSVFKGWIDEHTFKAAKAGTGMVIAVKRLNQEGSQGHKECKRRVLRVIDARIEGQYKPSGALRAAILAVKCIAIEPKYRPTMDEVVKALEQLQDTGIVQTEEEAQRQLHFGNGQSSTRKTASYPRPSALL